MGLGVADETVAVTARTGFAAEFEVEAVGGGGGAEPLEQLRYYLGTEFGAVDVGARA